MLTRTYFVPQLTEANEFISVPQDNRQKGFYDSAKKASLKEHVLAKVTGLHYHVCFDL